MPRMFTLKFDSVNPLFETPTSWRLYFYDYPPIYIPKKHCFIDEDLKVATLPGWLVDKKRLYGRVSMIRGHKARRLQPRVFTDADEPPI